MLPCKNSKDSSYVNMDEVKSVKVLHLPDPILLLLPRGNRWEWFGL